LCVCWAGNPGALTSNKGVLQRKAEKSGAGTDFKRLGANDANFHELAEKNLTAKNAKTPK